jgi:L-ascorbate metabolism protein UlaG (beta-lactamase superfamily)
MKITKYGHCCLRIEEQGLVILTDPGTFSETQNEETGIDLILITHEHADHYHVPSVKAVLAKNPQAVVITNTAVAKLLEKEGVASQILEHGQTRTEKDVLLEAFGDEHAPMLPGIIPDVQNTGYFIGGRLFYPGDSFTIPGKSVDVLAIPVAAPWLKLSEVFEYVKAVKPKTVFPVHDALYPKPGMADRFYKGLMPPLGVEYVSLNPGETIEV